VVVYDNLVSKPILEMARRDAERIYVGKKRNDHTLPQEQIKRTAGAPGQGRQARVAPQGRRPVHIRRGGEEIETLPNMASVPGRARHHRGFRRGFLRGIR